MAISRRTFMANVGGAAAVGLVKTNAHAVENVAAPAELAGFDAQALRESANADGEFRWAAREWDADVRLGIGDYAYKVRIEGGHVTDVQATDPGGAYAVSIVGPMQAWTEGFGDRGLEVEGDDVAHRWPYQDAILRLAALTRGTLGSRTAGSDSRQWRHLLEDRELQKKFRMIAYDLPFHGHRLASIS